MFIDFNQIARIGKIVALLAFFLPWVTVSCSTTGTDLLHATGWQLMTGDPQPAEGLASADNEQLKDVEPSIVIIAAFGVILIGLVTSLLNRTQAAAISMLVSAVLGIGITYFGMQSLQTELRSEIVGSQSEARQNESDDLSFEDIVAGLQNEEDSGGQEQRLRQVAADNISIQKEEGYWLTLGALALAALFSLLTLFQRRTPAVQPPP